MKIKMFVSFVLFVLLALFFVQCSNPVSSPQDIPIKTLLSAENTLLIENKSVVLSTYLQRDFQPISPPDGKPLIAVASVETTDSSIISSSINLNAIYIVYNNQVWKSFFTNEERPSIEMRQYRIVKIARDGPKWGPKIYVDVIVSLEVGNNNLLLKASKQYISRTD